MISNNKIVWKFLIKHEVEFHINPVIVILDDYPILINLHNNLNPKRPEII